MEDRFEKLNNKQKEAILATNGPVLIIAGPGSGKTRVLTRRIAYLIEKRIANPGNILAVTFTNKAAKEMQERVRSIIPIDYPRFTFNIPFGTSNIPTIGTFHSVCLRILRQEAQHLGYKKEFVVFDADDQISLVKKAMKELDISKDQLNPNLALNIISNAKNELKSPEECAELADGFLAENVSKIYQIYQERLRDSSAFDFDDLIMKTTVLFRENPEVLKKYQDIFKFIMVDEYQDTNYAQYNLMNLLSAVHKNLCVVGDDWQSIYRWRGADITNILEFEKNYPEAKVVMLEQNYRSTQPILDAAYGVISKNINRKEKKLWTEKLKGNQIIAYEAADEKGEAEFIVSEIAKLSNGVYGERVALNDFAILYRTNAQSRAVEEAFLQYNVPYRIVGGIKFYMRREVKDIIAYLRFIQNPDDAVSFERIVNVPGRAIGKMTLSKVVLEAKRGAQSIIEAIENYQGQSLKGKLSVLKEFASMIRGFEKKDPDMKTLEFLDHVIKKIGYQKYICDGTEEGETRWENVKELFSAVEKYREFPWKEGMKMFMEEVSLATDLDNLSDEDKSVTLMTLHSAKGLEFDTVFIIGLEEGLLPHSRSIEDPAEMEEERRLCYVGITRAKNRVYVIFARIRKIYGSTQINTPSRFISDIPEHLVEHRNQGYSYLGGSKESTSGDEGYEYDGDWD